MTCVGRVHVIGNAIDGRLVIEGRRGSHGGDVRLTTRWSGATRDTKKTQERAGAQKLYLIRSLPGNTRIMRAMHYMLELAGQKRTHSGIPREANAPAHHPGLWPSLFRKNGPWWDQPFAARWYWMVFGVGSD